LNASSTLKKIVLPACFAALCRPAPAATEYYLVPVYGIEGQTSIDYKYWNTKPSGSPAQGAPEIGVGYNVNSRWYMELFGSYRHTTAQGTDFYGLNWQNDVLLAQGQYPFDLAVHTNFEQYADGGYGVEFGPALQTEIERTQFNVNVFLQRDYHTGKFAPMQLVYQWQIRQHWKPLLNVGVQGFGELGQWNNWNGADQQSYRIGPALFGSWHMSKTRELKYETAYLIGKIAGHSERSWTMRLQYAF
jgi:hypothetical protein